MKNADIADIFQRIADMTEILGGDTFRINSYRKAARTLEELPEAVEDLSAAGRLEEIPGIGKSTAQKIRQYLATGKIEKHEELLTQVPPDLIGLMRLPGLGPKTAAKLWKEAGIASIEQLRDAIQNHPDKITSLAGMGEKKVKQLAESLAFVESSGGRMRLGEADALAADLVSAVKQCKGAGRVMAAGSLRRGRETIGDIDLLCEADPADAPGIIAAFAGHGRVHRVLAQGDTKGSVLLGQNAQADLRVVPGESFGAALAYFTGSKAHNIRLREMVVKRGWKLNEYGLTDGEKQIAGADEEGIYKALGMQFVPPELREDRGEIEAALAGKLPDLLTPGDIKGDFHMHTTASDGGLSIDEMIDACRQRGYRMMAITDHSRSQRQAHGMEQGRLLEHVDAIHSAAARHKDMLVLAGCEVDILKDGKLDYDDGVLAKLDFVIASPHAALSQGRQEATARLIAAIESPRVNAIGHPTGRLINERPGMEIDIEAIAKAAARHGVALEINAHFVRLDLRDTHVRAAIDAGAKLIINSDAHNALELDVMRFGVTTARRGWATKADVLNTWPTAKFKAFLKKNC